jgi:hypothetical protein
MKRRKRCTACDAKTLQVAKVNEYSRPVWECGNCCVETPRRVRKVMKSDPELERLFEELSK